MEIRVYFINFNCCNNERTIQQIYEDLLLDLCLA